VILGAHGGTIRRRDRERGARFTTLPLVESGQPRQGAVTRLIHLHG
jgi:hypothetical protein